LKESQAFAKRATTGETNDSTEGGTAWVKRTQGSAQSVGGIAPL
jgi:hypothetical protein